MKWLCLRNSSGVALTLDDSDGLGGNSRIFYTPTTSGTYFLDAQESGVDAYGTYRIIVNSTPTAGTITLGTSLTGTVDFNGDVDRYSVYLTAGNTYAFSLNGTTLLNPYVEVQDGTGTNVASDDDSGGGLNSYVAYTPAASGTYYLAARASGNNATGSYSAQVRQLPSVSIADATVTEGNTGATNLVFTLTLSAASPIAVTVAVTTSATSTATSGIDFSATSATVTIAAGQTTATFAVPVYGDMVFEPTEVFYATLSSPSGAVIGDGTGVGRIVDNDSPYTDLPTDSFLKYQWYLYDNKGINVFPVWSSYTGRGVRVAVFDWGVDATNQDLGANVLTSLGRKASDLSVGGSPILTTDNHGTAVAGVIAAAANGYENVGVAYDSKIVPIYNTGATSEISNAFTYAQTFDILNNSWGYGSNFYSGTNWAFVDDFSKPAFVAAAAALKSLADNGRGGLGTVVVQSAGNSFGYGDDTNLHNFQNSRYIITVGATDYAGHAASYSSPGASILVSAPGGDGSGYTQILTTDRAGANGYDAGDYTFISGTSFSSPIVAGVVALMLEANPHLGYRDVQEILAYSARETDPVNNTWIYNGAPNWNGGGLHFDATNHDLGYGLVDALAAVRLAETWSNTARTSANVYELSYSHAPHVAIPDYNYLVGVGSVYDTIHVQDNMRIERIEVALNITHTWVGDLYVLLRSPTTLESSFLISRPGSGALSAYGSSQDNIHFTLDTVLNWGESAVGDWLIGVFDGAGGSVGTLDSWTIKFIGSPISSDNTYIYTNEFAEATADQASRSILSDSGGTDTLNAAACTTNLVLNLAPGGVSTIDGRSLTIAVGTVIENAYGGDGDDTITGNITANVLYGMRGNDHLNGDYGNDTLYGGAGNDTFDWDASGRGGNDVFYGGSGNDTYVLDSALDSVIEYSGEGTDTVWVCFSYSIVNLPDIEFLYAFGTIGVSLTGNAADNTLDGTSANDTIDGGTGNDIVSYAGVRANYTITATSDGFTIANTSEGTDTLRSIEFAQFSDQTVNLSAIDATAPTVSAFNPADEANNVAITSNIVITFSENITKGSGDITLKTATGATIATYDVATSTNLSISGSTLTINPTADLAYSTGYKVEFAAGAIKDLAGNSYAGTTSYNFTTANGVPVATSATVSAVEDTAKTGTLTGTDPEISTLTFAKVADPNHGTVTINATTGAYVYTPVSNYNGADSFAFKVNDGTADSAASTVSITVSAVNDAPVASNTNVSTAEDTALTSTLPVATDVDGDTINYSKASEP